MAPRIIRGARARTKGGSSSNGGRDGRVTVVIADSGAEAEVLVFPPGEKVERGAEFHYRGARWIITGSRRDSGILVAEPASH